MEYNHTELSRKNLKRSIDDITNKIGFILDFDCTITYVHFFHFIHNFIRVFCKNNGWDNHLTSVLDKYKIDREIFISKLKELNITKSFITVFDASFELFEEQMNLFFKNFNGIDAKNCLKELFFGSEERFNKIETFLKICKEKDIPVYISSHGYTKHICNLLQFFNILHLFEGINGISNNSSHITLNVNDTNVTIYNSFFSNDKQFFIENLLRESDLNDRTIYFGDDDFIAQTTDSFKNYNLSLKNLSNIKLFGNIFEDDKLIEGNVVEHADILFKCIFGKNQHGANFDFLIEKVEN